MASIKVSGMDALLGALEATVVRVPALASAITRKAGLDIEAHAKTTVPVDTGATKNSIGMDVAEDEGSVEVVVGPETWYAPLLETGTSRMAPRPFMGPAFDAVEPGWSKALKVISNPLAGP